MEIAKQYGSARYIHRDDGVVFQSATSSIHYYKMMMYQILCTYDQMFPIQCGGVGVICDGDCAQLRKKRKMDTQLVIPHTTKLGFLC